MLRCAFIARMAGEFSRRALIRYGIDCYHCAYPFA
jgi:hypothetical protein